jgi:hypothetical protein
VVELIVSISKQKCERKSFHQRGGGKVFREEGKWVAAPVMKTRGELNRNVNLGYGD